MTHTIRGWARAAWRVGTRGGFWGAVVMIAALGAAGSAEASTYRWLADAGGQWTDAGAWELVEGPLGLGYPNLAGDVAVFDEPLTANRVITIPDGETIRIGRLSVGLWPPPGKLTITNAGSGLLVFDNAGEDAVIDSPGGEGQAVSLETPIQLATNVNVASGSYEFLGGIGEAGGARNVTISGAAVTYAIAANTYTGTTTVASGEFRTVQEAVPVQMLGTLIVGDGAGAAGTASARLSGESLDQSAGVLVRADGSVIFERNNSLTSFVHTIGDLTVEGGKVTIQITASTLVVQGALTMEGGEIVMGSSGGANSLRLLGAVNATSTAAGSAAIRTLGQGLAFLTLSSGTHNFTIVDGPQAVDLQIDAPINELNPGASVIKVGAGTMLMHDASYTGATSASAGQLIVDGTVPPSTSHVTAFPDSVLSGTGTMAAGITVAGTLSPGRTGVVGTMSGGPVNFGGGSHFAVDIQGAASADRLNVTGETLIGTATLDVTSVLALPPQVSFTIIANDASEPVTGTFAGLPEGTVFTTTSGAAFRISYEGGDGNDVVLVNVTPQTYFLSEGATGTFFDEDVLIANPNAVAAPVTMTFFLPGGGTVVHPVTVPAQSRLTVAVDEIDGLGETSPSVEVRSDSGVVLGVERTMFWDSTHYGGHTANSVASAERQWFFAEGAQNAFFNTYLLLANPAGAQNATVTFLRENDPPFVLEVPLDAQSRTTVSAGDHPELVGRSFGITVDAPNPITAERAMYFASTPQRLWSGGHDNVGSPEAATSWFHPEGASGTFFTTFILMSNPQNVPANVTMRFLLPSGAPVEITKSIGASQRLTVNPAAEGILALENAAFSTVVTSDVPIVSERAMYWNTDDTFFGEGHASSGLTALGSDWLLAEGRVGGDNAYTTYILLANPGATDAEVTVSFLRETTTTPVVKTYTVPANSRFNIDVGAMVTELQNESFGARIVVTSGPEIAVERSMYWNVEGRFWSGGTNAVGSVVP